jgi:hypothetical protein
MTGKAADFLLRAFGRPPSLIATGAIVLLCHGSYVLAVGATAGSDSASYAYWSQRLIDSGFDYPSIIAQVNSSFPPVLYVLFGTVLALLRLAFGQGWPVALVALNLAGHLGLAVLLVRLAVRLTASATAGWTALLLFLACFDLVRWVPFLLSDATFVFLAFSIFALASARILGEARGWSRVFALAAIGVFYRPTGMVLLPDLAWALYLSRTRRNFRRVPLLAILATATAVSVLIFLWLVQDPARWPFDALAGAFAEVAKGYGLGEVVSARLETHHAPPVQFDDFLLLFLDRLAHFFAVGAGDFSLVHWGLQFAFFLPCYALAGWLVVALWRGDTPFGAVERKVFLAAVGAVLAYALFHGLVQVDFDWRYRNPILPHLILLAAGGVADLVRRRVRR